MSAWAGRTFAGDKSWSQQHGRGRPLGAVRTRAFARARRHSRCVRFYKLAIPVGAVVGGHGRRSFVAFFNPFRHVEGLTLGPVSVSGTQVTMESPKLTGSGTIHAPTR